MQSRGLPHPDPEGEGESILGGGAAAYPLGAAMYPTAYRAGASWTETRFLPLRLAAYRAWSAWLISSFTPQGCASIRQATPKLPVTLKSW